MPCGTGKSLAAYWISETLNARSILVAVPSLALVRQTLTVWARESLAKRKDIDWICVCSDPTVGDIGREDIAVLTQDLGVKIHTNSDEIAEWLGKRRKGLRVVMTTYQSGRAISEAARKANKVFDLGILDEAHKTVGRKDSLFSHLLHDANIRIRKRVFMTATERRYIGPSDEIASMADLSLYGDTFELLSFKSALEREPPILSDYRIVTIFVTRSEVAKLIDRNLYVRPDKGKWDGDVEAEMLAAAIALRKAVLTCGIRHAVSFHSSIARAKAFKETQEILTAAFPEYRTLDTFHVSGAIPTSVRERIIDEFEESSRSLVTNARCLTEGVDVPNIDCVLFADPRRSTIDIVQATGRALRPAPGKKLGYVIVPVLLDETEGLESMVQSDAFDTVLTTLRALAANDDRIIEHFRTISQGKRPGRGTTPVSMEVPLGLRIDAEEFARSIELRYWSRLAKLSWRPFEKAREFVRGLGLRNFFDWRAYSRGEMPDRGKRPDDIPGNPSRVYKDKGWAGLGDWLGTDTIATYLREYRPFREARRFARSLRLKSNSEWNSFCRGEMPEKGTLPNDIPRAPGFTYRDTGWSGVGDWLGTGTIAPTLRKYRPFEEAREFARGLELGSNSEWRRFCKGEMPDKGTLPDDISGSPDRTYKDSGWVSWGDWLGTGVISRSRLKYRPFEKAREFARGLALRSGAEWRQFCRGEMPQKGVLPDDISASPDKTYRNRGWAGMGDWLGTGALPPGLRRYPAFEEAREFARGLALGSQSDWVRFCKGEIPEKGKRPNGIPTNPNNKYKDAGWVSWGDWLGTGRVPSGLRKYRPFDEAREFARSLGLRNNTEWRRVAKGEMPEKGRIPDDIPTCPDQTYRSKGWKGWGDWLGTGNIANYLREYRDFAQAREFARSLRLKGESEWRQFCKGEMPEKGNLPRDIPSNPGSSYRNHGWVGMGDWLGTGTVAPRRQQYRPFSEARIFARSLGLKSGEEWSRFCKGSMSEKGMLPDDIPATPRNVYRDEGWAGMGDWLGTGATGTRLRKHRPFEEAREFARGLKLKNQSEWGKFCKGEMPEIGERPIDIPANPHRVYRNEGWAGLGDWLGTGTVATRRRERKPFREARRFARGLEVTSSAEWRRFCKGEMPEKGVLPRDIPANPDRCYRGKGWVGYGDWLGTGNLAPRARREAVLRRHRAFGQAREFARGLQLRSAREWQRFCRGGLPEKGALPDDIPSNPGRVYRGQGWAGMKDWLGVSAVAKHRQLYKPFDKAREFARGLGLRSHSEWKLFCKGEMPGKGELPRDIPSHPDHVYKNKGWLGVGDWLGTGNVANFLREFRPFEEAREFARGLQLTSGTEWRKFCKGEMPEKGRLPDDIPAHADRTYRNKGWARMGDWLGTDTVATRSRRYRPFGQARVYARSLGLKSYTEWRKFCKGEMPEKGKRPDDIPASPGRTYKDKGWAGTRDWLGTRK
jgi:superfamily II DNA or RNA helicase